MYRCFKLFLELEEIQKTSKEYIETCKAYGVTLRKELIESFECILNKAIDKNGIISGEEFINTWFPVENYDVFLSYSHDDEDTALFLAGFLRSEFGLNVFVDELFWGNADQLLKKLDNKYCIDEKNKGYYDYHKRNFTTAHVHAMLATAIARAINRSEIIIFLNSNKSIYKIEEEIKKNRTLSPWIYEEIFFTSVIDKKEWYEHRTGQLQNERKAFQESMQVSYILPDEHLIPMDYNDLCNWKERWKTKNKIGNGRYGELFRKNKEKILHPLNVLYKLKESDV